MFPQLILASASPRRKQLLDQINIRYSVHAVDIDETPGVNESPISYCQRLAAEKSAACVAKYKTTLPVLAADTIVVLDHAIMGKPVNEVDAITMLRQLSGKTHQVYTAVSLRGKKHSQAVSVTEVTFRKLSEKEIICYWQSQEPLGKAGAYAIQGLASVFVERIRGSFSGVVGLPLFETAELLSQHNIEVFNYE
jgi:septum formation protein